MRPRRGLRNNTQERVEKDRKSKCKGVSAEQGIQVTTTSSSGTTDCQRVLGTREKLPTHVVTAVEVIHESGQVLRLEKQLFKKSVT